MENDYLGKAFSYSMSMLSYYQPVGYLCYRYPFFGSKLWRIFCQVEKTKYRLLSSKFDSYTNKSPTHIVHVDPVDITYCEKTFEFDRMRGRVVDGDWDQGLKTFEDNDVFQCLRERYEEGREWDRIKYVQECRQAVQEGQTVWQNVTSVTEIRDHCRDIDDLADSIKEHGILEPIDLLDRGVPARPYNIPKLNVGRDGGLILNSDGTHRTALGKILDVDTMPVWINVRHADWQAVRDEIAAGGTVPTEYESHPDLSDLTS
jgi:hypothetical protein